MGERSDDSELVARLRNGSQTAATTLYRRHAPLVRFVVTDNVRDLDDIEDVVQEAFGRAFGRVDTLTNPECFRAWLLQIARRAAIDARRARCRRPEMSTIDHHVLVDDGPTPDLVVEVRELALRVGEGIADLSSRDRAVLTMVIELGFSLADVAEALDVGYGAAKVILHRARRRLRAVVAAAIDEPVLVSAGF